MTTPIPIAASASGCIPDLQAVNPAEPQAQLNALASARRGSDWPGPKGIGRRADRLLASGKGSAGRSEPFIERNPIPQIAAQRGSGAASAIDARRRRPGVQPLAFGGVTPERLADAVLAAAAAALAEMGIDPLVLPATASVERPRNAEHGDYASPLALQVAKRAGVAPDELARAIAGRLAGHPAIRSVEGAGGGFLNIRLASAATGQVAGIVVEQGAAYGHGSALAGQRVNLEFVSANPTGPIHIGGVRWAAVGDALARLLRAHGANVVTEYYFNDAGAQIERFTDSLLAAARGEATPPDGYAGEYIREIARAVLDGHHDALGWPAAQARGVFRSEGVALMFDEIKDSLAGFGVHFDVFFAEKDLHARGELGATLARLRRTGRVYDAEGATWVRTSDFGDDKDRVYVRSNGEFTYFAADCAYYLDKRRRGFGKVVLILGADHHGYVGRMRAIAACLGDNPDQTLEILIGQMVNLLRNGQPVRMSKRAGTVVTIGDIVDAIGVDAARYALARYSLDATIDLDLDLWTRQTNENPVFYVQYAHARISSLLGRAAEAGITLGDGYNPSLLTHDRENDLLKALAEFPRVVAAAAELRQPHRLARYLEDLSGAYHRFYDACRVLPRDAGRRDGGSGGGGSGGGGSGGGGPGDTPRGDLGLARLWLAAATRIVLANGLYLLGVSAPERL